MDVIGDVCRAGVKTKLEAKHEDRVHQVLVEHEKQLQSQKKVIRC